MTTLPKQTILVTQSDDTRFFQDRLGVAYVTEMTRAVTEIETVDQFGGIDALEGVIKLGGRTIRVAQDYDGTWSIIETGGWIATK
jgi:hypothetical protein